VITAGIAVYGLHGIGYLDFFLSQSGNPVMDLFYVVSPHYHLADLTNRLVFHMGPLEGSAFARIVAYFIGLGVVIVGVGVLLYKEKK